MKLLTGLLVFALLLAPSRGSADDECGNAEVALESGPFFEVARRYHRRVLERRRHVLVMTRSEGVLDASSARACAATFRPPIRGRVETLTSSSGYVFVMVRMNDVGDGANEYGLFINARTRAVALVVAQSNFQT